jgi:hypothetical protein
LASFFTQRYWIFSSGHNIGLCPFRFFLSHKDIFTATITKEFAVEFPKNLHGDDFMNHWNTNTSVTVNHFKESDNQIKLFLNGGTGRYDKSSGEVYYEIFKKRPIITFW